MRFVGVLLRRIFEEPIGAPHLARSEHAAAVEDNASLDHVEVPQRQDLSRCV